MNVINAGNNNENSNISDILIVNETSPEPLSYKEISGDIMDSPVKISVDPIKIFQNAGTKISDIIIEKCDNLSRNISSMDTKDLHNLSPLQYPLFNEVKTTDYSLLKTSLFIGSSIALVLFMRYKGINISNGNNENDENNIIDNVTNSNDNNSSSDSEVVEVTDNCLVDTASKSKKKSLLYFTNLFSLW